MADFSSMPVSTNPTSHTNSDSDVTPDNITGEINASNAVIPHLNSTMALSEGHIGGSIRTIHLQENIFRNIDDLNVNPDPEDFNFNEVVIVNDEMNSDGLGLDYESDSEYDDFHEVMYVREYFVDISEFHYLWNPENLAIDPIKRITRYNRQLNPRSPSKEFIPIKLTENVVFILPVLFTKKNVLPSDLFSLCFGIASEYKSVINHVLNGTNGIFVVSRKCNKNTTILGTTVEIYKINGHKGSVIFPINLMAHQMCEILSVEPFPGVLGTTSIGLAKIKILPANISCYPYRKLSPTTRNRYSRGDNAIGDRCMQTQWPSWMYKQLDPVNLASRLVAKVKLLYTDISLTFDDPYVLSFDVLNLNIFTEEQRHYLQAMNSTHLRIHYEIQSMDTLICFCCSAVVTSIENVFNMPHVSKLVYGGRYYRFQNMGMVTTSKLNVEVIIGSELSSMHCLHTGYKWQEVSCGSCSNLLGCRYVTEQNSLQTPKIFFGLRRSAITSSKYYLPKQVVQKKNPLSHKESNGYWSLIQD